MRKSVIAACAAVFVLGFAASSSTAAAGYSAIAAGVNGVGWAVGATTMEGARAIAVAKCRELGGSCSESTAEDDSWSFAGGRCNGHPYTGGSPQGIARAIDIVNRKGAADRNYGCNIDKAF